MLPIALYYLLKKGGKMMKRMHIFYSLILMMACFSANAQNSQVFDIDLSITKETVLCSGKLSIIANELKTYVDGKYPNYEFKSNLRENSCFYKNILIEKASESGGKMIARVGLSKRNIREPIYSCEPPPCSFCPPGNCKVVGYDEFIQEQVIIDIYGLKFHGSSKLN